VSYWMGRWLPGRISVVFFCFISLFIILKFGGVCVCFEVWRVKCDIYRCTVDDASHQDRCYITWKHMFYFVNSFMDCAFYHCNVLVCSLANLMLHFQLLILPHPPKKLAASPITMSTASHLFSHSNN
jgi:hypothetical protein